MAGDVEISDRVVEEDFNSLKAVGVLYKVLLDVSHDPNDKDPAKRKAAHLEIELDFGQLNEPDFQTFLSNFKQRHGKTFKKLLFGKFDPQTKRMSAKYEAQKFSTNVFNKARNARELKRALIAFNSPSGVVGGMMKVDFT